MSRLLPERIETDRTLLRGPQATDARTFFEAFTQDPEVARYTTWRPHTSSLETETFIADCTQAWKAGSRLPYVLELKGEGPIGILEARIRGHVVDIGYVLARRYWGRGLMSEAIRALAGRALDVPAIHRVQATCDAENVGSFRALEKAGFVREGRLERYTVHPNLSPEPRPCFMYARCR